MRLSATHIFLAGIRQLSWSRNWEGGRP